ncbi:MULTISPECIES: calcium-transporting P-type ATPase, PMR1-type [Methanobacterium]|uniref:P-type Ca(2+) transporter n=1 Tax=Methanobacterium veterum TaxID=408577 RepID=A0A9E5A730_9EURY|nr:MULTISPECIES: calcium-transporting P-type ATPase, PMR1-type [Methanobacterium]MCZ3365058.1 calcium-transporting P-type ATPase, PMR1-type [Methanobacterium veterum]MCZ3372813.1 calcium-transporting P-type ATPase, PMR1-type [Methanobacterium veterum]
MKWQKSSVDETLKTLNSDANKGLAEEEAKKRNLKFGLNELVEKEKPGPIRLFLGQFKEILIVILIFAAIAAYYVGDAIDAIVILIVVVINAVVGFIQEYRAEKAMEKLKGLISNEAVVIRDGKKQKIPAKNLTPGDIVVIEEGDNIPADLRLIQSFDLRVDESALTGESVPAKKHSEIVEVEEETGNLVFMDTDVSLGRGKGVVVAVGMETEIGKIAELIQEEDEDTPLHQKIGRLGRNLGILALVVCSVVFVLQYLQGLPIIDTFLTAISLAVAAVPEGLPAILTLTLALGMQRMAKSNAIVRKLLAVETLGSCNVICTDKTGTLTKNKMTVRETRITAPEKAFEISALCNNAVLNEGKLIGDPTDGAILAYAEENGYTRSELEKIHPRLLEIPLDSVRKRMTTVNDFNGTNYVLVKGAPEIVLDKCMWIEKDARPQKLAKQDKDIILNDLKDMTGKALRVLALAYKKLTPAEQDLDSIDKDKLEENLVFVGLVGMMDPPRQEAKEAVATCMKAGIRVVMITGDHEDTAAAIGKEIGILTEGKVLTGSELDKLSDAEFKDMVDDIQVYARVFPEQKVRIVEALKEKGNITSMTGDGVNDAPALKRAAIGVAMGSGTDVAKESADMLLQDDNFATIVKAVKEGRIIFDNIRRFVRFQLSTNIGAILTITSASILSLPVPFNPIQVLWINIIMDGPPAQSLGVEPPEKNVMERAPLKEEIIPRKNLLKIAIAGVVMTVGTLVLYYLELVNGAGTLKATTIAFTVFVMFQIFNVFNCRAEKFSNFSNKFLVVAIGLSFLLQLAVIYIPFLQGVFRTTALSLIDWAAILIVACLIFVSDWLVERFMK